MPPRTDERVLGPLRRRRFLQVSAAATAALFAACGDEEEQAAQPPRTETQPTTTGQPGQGVTLDFSQPTAIANYALALELLEQSFYQRVTDDPFPGITSRERRLFDDLRQHETAHVDFLRGVLGEQAISGLETDFSEVDFGDRSSVFATAATFEPLGVAAYNGAARFIPSDTELGMNLLLAAGEIVSVEGRHAAVIQALQDPGRNGAYAPEAFDDALVPSRVLPKIEPFLATPITVQNLPRGA